MADLSLTLQSFNDGTGGSTSGFPAVVRIIVTTNSIAKEYYCAAESILLIYDNGANYLEIYSNNHCLYKYVQGDTFGNSSVATASQMIQNISIVLYT